MLVKKKTYQGLKTHLHLEPQLSLLLLLFAIIVVVEPVVIDVVVDMLLM